MHDPRRDARLGGNPPYRCRRDALGTGYFKGSLNELGAAFGHRQARAHAHTDAHAVTRTPMVTSNNWTIVQVNLTWTIVQFMIGR